jgi:hypothetical protein
MFLGCVIGRRGIRAAEKINHPNLLVSGSVFCVAPSGEYSTICTAWTALNTDPYSAHFGIIYYFRGPKIMHY